MIVLRSLWLGGAARPVAIAADDDASVGPITEGAKPVAGAAGPITEGAKRRMSQSSLGAPPNVAEQNHPQGQEGKRLQVSCKR